VSSSSSEQRAAAGGTQAANDGVVELRLGEQRAVVCARGAALRAWEVDGVERLSWFDPGDPRHRFDGGTLVPWPNRIRDGRYTFAGEAPQLPVTEPGRKTALHGLASTVAWDVVERGPERVRLARWIGPQEGYPWTIEVEAVFRLTRSGVEAELTATNRGERDAPFGAGWHPYFALPAGVDAAQLQMPAPMFVPVDARALPLGELLPVRGTGLDFSERRGLAGVALDTCFALSPDADGRARIRLWPTPDAAPVTMWLGPQLRFVHVYTVDDAEPGARRTRIAIEPISCPPDAFNLGWGLVTLEPGRPFRAGWGLER
jgi:aldose 1-epimerase